MPNPAPITYQDYIRHMSGRGGSEGSSGAIDEATWNALSTKEQFNNLQGGLVIAKDDPRYTDMAKQLGISNGSNIMIGGGAQAHAGDKRWWVDPTAVINGEGWSATGIENQTPYMQQQANASGMTEKQWIAAALSVAGMGALPAGTFAGGEVAGSGLNLAAEGTGAFDMAGSAGVFDSMGYPLYPGGMEAAGGAAGGGTSGSTNWFQQANRFRQGFNGARSIMNLIGGGPGGSSSGSRGGNGMDFDFSSFMNMLGLGRSVLGRGVGTSEGATTVGRQAAERADPWGSSGQRQRFSNMLTPDVAQNLMGLNAQGMHTDIRNNPAYQFAMQEGTNAINVGNAAQGSLHSGNRMYELQRYGTGLATQYENQYRQQNLQSLGALGQMAGVNHGSPAEAGRDLISGFTGATNLQNNGLDALFGNGGNALNRAGNSIFGLIGQGADGLNRWLQSLFGGNGGVNVNGIPDFSGADADTAAGWFDGGASETALEWL